MRAQTRHPRLVAAACQLYRLTLWLYPAEFRRAWRAELTITFRNRVEDVLDGGGLVHCCAFASHIAVDCLRTWGTVATPSGTSGSASLLGLGDGDAASGCLDRRTLDVSLLFAVTGFMLACVGWYVYLMILPSFFG